MSTHDDLATLRFGIGFNEALVAALDRVEAEVTRLREGLRQADECCARPSGTCFARSLLAESQEDSE